MKHIRNTKYTKGMLAAEIIMVFISLIILAPIVYLFVASFKNKAEINRPLSLPSGFYYKNYIDAVQTGNFFTLLLNSVVVCAAVIILIIVFGSLAAYPLSRRDERVFKIVYLYFLSGLMIPFMTGIVPLFKLIKGIGLIDKISSLILINFAISVPMSVFIYTGFIKTVPKELDEAALVDGAGMLRTFFMIIFPLLKPASVSVVFINILPLWNDFMTPLLFISSNSRRTLPLGMYNFISQFVVDYGPIFAFGVLVTVFPITLFLSLQKYFYKGIVSGAVKG